MSAQTCPDCGSECLEDEERCGVCGARLQEGPTVPAALAPLGTLAGSAIWLDELAPAPSPPAPAAPAPPPPPPVKLTLRSIDVPEPVPASAVSAAFDADDSGVADPLAPREVAPPVYEEIVLPPITEAERLQKARADRRASVRRSRLRLLAAAPENVAAVPEVLVIDLDDGARAQTVTLLLAFGFGVHSATSPEKAAALLDAHQFVAVFADLALDGGDGGAGIELCRRIKADRAHRTLLVYMAQAPTPIDRIRAQLAGCDDMIAKPTTRGSVAGVLDMHGVMLPTDARRT